MKVNLQAENQINYSRHSHPQAKSQPKRVSFGMEAGIAPFMDTIGRGGLGAAFIIQDFLGMVVPRAIAGLSRNKDITGENNYQEAAEVTIREGVSGPSLFLIPMAMLWGIKKYFGKANDVPVHYIKALGNLFVDFARIRRPEDLKNEKYVKEKFYHYVFENVLNNAYDDTVDVIDIPKKAAEYAKRLIAIENAPKKSFKNKIKNIADPKSSNDMMAALVHDFATIRKSSSCNPSANFSKLTLTLPRKDSIESGFESMMGHLRNFSEDISATFAKKFKPKNGVALLSEDVMEFVRNFAKSRSGSRILTNIALITGIVGFGLQIPKFYQLSQANPGLNGLTAENMLKKDEKNANN